MFETDREVLEWYERQPRALSKDFVDSIPWGDVPRYPLNPAFVPVLLYMRDVESFTEVYYQELLRTPTCRNPHIRKFMDRWSVEENEHANLLNRFLNEAGIPSSTNWSDEAKAAIPLSYTVQTQVGSAITRVFGKHFSGVHMVWGAINEMTTLQGYRRLWHLAGHPVLEHLLRAIAQEESIHSSFYWNIARLRLERSGFTRKLSRFVINNFWTPVGQGTKPQNETDYVIATLFKGASGVNHFERTVGQRMERLPGFSGLKVVTERIASISIEGYSRPRLISI
ncbi:MAG: acyl-ACP desaturase [Pyrinomonadaceae bacterium]